MESLEHACQFLARIGEGVLAASLGRTSGLLRHIYELPQVNMGALTVA